MITISRFLFLILVIGMALCSGCRSGGHRNPDVLVRFIDASPETGELTIAVDGQKAWKGARYCSNTGYQGIAEGTYNVTLQAEGDTPEVALRPLAFRKGAACTLVAFGERRGEIIVPHVHLFQDQRDVAVPAGKARLRVINAITGGESFDVLFNNIVGLKSVAPEKRTQPLLLDCGDYEIKAIPAGSLSDPLIGPVPLHLEAGHAYTLVAMGSLLHGKLTMELYRDD